MKYVDIRWTNLCNFKCRFCGFGLSSAWYEDLSKRHPYDFNFPLDHKGNLQRITKKNKVLRNNISLEEIKEHVLPNAKHIQLVGGEPLIDINTYEILNHLIKIKKFDVHINIVSNISKLSFNNYHILDLLQYFDVSFSASIDGIEKQAEYLRSGTVWPKIEENLRLINNFYETQKNNKKKSFVFKVMHTVYALNLFHSPKVYDYLVEVIKVPYIKLNLCFSPKEYLIQTLPIKLKKEALSMYSSLNNGFYSPIIHILENSIKNHNEKNDQNFENLKHEILVYDDIRKENFLETFPEFNPYWQ